MTYSLATNCIRALKSISRKMNPRRVLILCNPTHTEHCSICDVIALPLFRGGDFRLLEQHQLCGISIAKQAETINELMEKYRVEYIGIDATGIGQGVFQMVRQFFPAVRQIRYSSHIHLGKKQVSA
ncbi:hypothetical protein [Pantoea agglomerans]|uniref:Uncharacterized protein n=1 Tax=Enterobacter agglomerans TaxID=549 RepID=A0ACC5RKL9_ENTAG|nr:hypothetical protein [Pantoea agglomerans]